MPRHDTKAAYRFLSKILNNVKRWQILRIINTDKAPTYTQALVLLKPQGKCPHEVEYRQIKYWNNVIECDQGNLKRIISATLKGIKVMRALRKGQAESYYFSHSLGEIRLLARFFGTWTLSSARRHINFNICNSAVVRYVKNTAGRQRYLCSHCCKTLQLQFTYTASQPGTNQKVIYMDMNNVGCRVAARIMGIRLSTIFRHLKNSGSSQ